MVLCGHVWDTPLISLSAVTEKQKAAVSRGAEASAGGESHSIVPLRDLKERGGGKQRAEGVTMLHTGRGAASAWEAEQEPVDNEVQRPQNRSSVICGINL